MNIISYDGNGNLLAFARTPVGRSAYLWDHGGSALIAEAANAVPSDIAYTSFEADGSGNWTIGSTARSGGGLTGTRSYDISLGTITKGGLSAGTTYVISFWARSGAPIFSAGAPVAGRTKDGWTFYQKTFSGVTGIQLSGTGLVDEVTLRPANAYMKTYVHLPGVGVSCKVDENGYAEYYEYDSLGRLKFIRNGNGEIVRKIEYNYQIQ